MRKNLIICIITVSYCFISCATQKKVNMICNIDEVIDSSVSVDEIIPELNKDQFTICVIPDIQKYTFYKTQKENGYPISTEQILINQVDWLVRNGINNGGPICFGVQVGDLVEEPTKKSEWDRAYNAMQRISDAMPLAITVGNHDTDRIRKTQNFGVTSFNRFNKLFGPNSNLYKDKDYYIESYDKQNSVTKFFVNNYKFIVISLELQPRNDTLVWLETILKKYKNYPTIVNIHEYMYPSVFSERTMGEINTKTDLRKGKNVNSAKDTWEKVLSKYNQVFLILSGHYWGNSFLTQINNNGYEVYSLHADYEGSREIIDKFSGYKKNVYPSGDGWLRLMTFDIENKRIYIQTYSPFLNREKVDSNSNYFITWEWDWETRFGEQ